MTTDSKDLQKAKEVHKRAIQENRSLLWEMWHDGGRALLVAFFIFAASVALLATSFIIYQIRPGPNAGLCEYPSPRKILNTVPGIDGPATRQGSQIIERAVRCVQGAPSLNVRAYRSFHNLDTGKSIPDLQGELQVRVRGSVTSDVPIQLPVDVTPGMWEMQGIDLVEATGELRTWYSEPFTVVP